MSERTDEQMARPLADELRGSAAAILDDQKQRLATVTQSIADILHEAAHRLEGESGVPLAQYGDRAADQVARFAAAVRQRSWQDLLGEVEGFARRRPPLFLAAALAAGFVGGRIIANAVTPPPPAAAIIPEAVEIAVADLEG